MGNPVAHLKIKGTDYDFGGGSGGGLVPTILWENGSRTSTFAGQTITLNDDISNYDYYEVIMRNTTENIRQYTSGIIMPSFGGNICKAQGYNYTRGWTTPSGTSLAFDSCSRYSSYGSSTSTNQNTHLIPIYVIGFKVS